VDEVAAFFRRRRVPYTDTACFAAGFEDKEDRYFTCSVAYMLAYAIWSRRYDVIELVGVDLYTKTEYQNQRPCVEFYTGWAGGSGIDVFVPRASALLSRPWLYGYEEPSEEVYQNASR
jgi:hypothetical protein